MPTLKSSQQIKTLIYARFVFITLQLIAITSTQYMLLHELPYAILYTIVAVEAFLNIGYLALNKQTKRVSSNDYLLQLAVDIVVLAALLFFSGGASNPFVSLLLIPIAIASVTLPKHLLLFVTLIAMCAYSLLLLTLDPHALHHMNMEQHFTGMWINFMLSALVIVVVITSLIRAMNRQERLLSTQREEQLRQEQLLSLGAAAAQFAHRLATPLGTANFLAEELKELNEDRNMPAQENTDLSNQLEQQLAICRHHLDNFRTMAEQVKSNSKQELTVLNLLSQLQEEVQLSFPQAIIDWQINQDISKDHILLSEPILVPALLNLIQNAIIASKDNGNHDVEVIAYLSSQHLTSQHLSLLIKDNGNGFANDTLLQLGSELVDSDNGLGMGVFLSHVTLEKLGGTLKLYNRQPNGAVAEINLPLIR